LCMLVAIVATGNHFILDAIAGAVVVGMAYSIVRLYPSFKVRFLKNRKKLKEKPEE
jgi:hypothetical protein